MWNKTRKALLERLAPSLKGRVDYHYAVYEQEPLPSLATFHVFYIRVDQQVWFATPATRQTPPQKDRRKY